MTDSVALGSNELLHLLMEKGVVAGGILREGILVHASPKLAEMFGASAVGRTLASLVAPEHRERVSSALLGGGEECAIEFQALRADGSRFDAELEGVRTQAGGPAIVFVATDVTARRRTEQHFSYMAYLDSLTGLPNRSLFLDRLHDALVGAGRDRRVFAVMMTDLDGFKLVNDEHGHDAGNIALEIVARRFERTLRTSDTVARLGGDEFAILLPNIARRTDAALVAERLIETLREPVDLPRGWCQLGVSIGIATYPAEAATTDRLVSCANLAMYESKRAGKNRFAYAAPSGEVAAPTIPFLHWTDANDVGNSTIDAQHRHLVTMINVLGDDLRAGRDRDTLVASLRAVVGFTVRHFTTEEKMMAGYASFERADQHAQEHKKLIAEISSLSLSVDSAGMTRTLGFLQEWFLRHIENEDRPLAKWILDHEAPSAQSNA